MRTKRFIGKQYRKFRTRSGQFYEDLQELQQQLRRQSVFGKPQTERIKHKKRYYDYEGGM